MDEPKIDYLIFPTMGGDFPSLLQVMLGVLAATANRWCVFGKLNLRLVFEYFSGLALPKGERPRSYSPHVLLVCSCKVFLGSKLILCGPSDVHDSL